MNHSPQTNVRLGVISLAALMLLNATLCGQEAKPQETTSRRYWLDVKVFSLLPGQESATYRSLNGGGVGPDGTLTLGSRSQQGRFDIRIMARFKDQRFLAMVSVKPARKNTHTKAQEIEYDLSDLVPRSLDVARDDDGRVYRLSLVPTIQVKPLPLQFNAADLRLEYWTFPSCPVILNDQDYIGRLGMASGPLAWCDIPGLAKVEFSLLHLKDALPLGTLENGVINITHESGTTLRISDVKNGVNRDVLGGGPYRVWVRWKKPSQSMDEHRESLKQQIAELRQRISKGDLSLPAGTLERLEKMSESGRIGHIGNGVSGVEEDELVKPVE